MKSKTDYSDMSIGLNLTTSLTTWDGDPSSYVVRVSGTIMPIGGDDPEEEVGPPWQQPPRKAPHLCVGVPTIHALVTGCNLARATCATWATTIQPCGGALPCTGRI